MLIAFFATLWILILWAYVYVIRQYRRGQACRINLLGVTVGVVGVAWGLGTAISLAGVL